MLTMRIVVLISIALSLFTYSRTALHACPLSCTCTRNSSSAPIKLWCNSADILLTYDDPEYNIEEIYIVTAGEFSLTLNDTYFYNSRLFNATVLIIDGTRTKAFNERWQMSANTLKYMKRLEELRLIDVGLSYLVSDRRRAICEGSFSHLLSIRILDLSRNSEVYLGDVPKAFKNIRAENLTYLNVSGMNAINQMAGYTLDLEFTNFVSHTKLRVLDLSWTRLFIIEAPFVNAVPYLEILNMSGTNPIENSQCMDEFPRLKSVKVLELNYWPTVVTSEERWRWKRAVHVNTTCSTLNPFLDGNCLKLPPSLEVLSFKHSDLIRYYMLLSREPCVNMNNSLKELYFSGVKWNSEKPIESFSGLHNLQLLDLQDLGIRYITKSVFADMPSLKILYLGGNKLGFTNGSILSGSLARTPNLEVLDLSRNNLAYLRGNIVDQNAKLEIFNLSGNVLKSFVVDLSKNVHIKMLDLSNNMLTKFEELPWASFQIHSKIRNTLNETNGWGLNLSGNLFDCQCSSLSTLKFISTLSEGIIFAPGSSVCIYNDVSYQITEMFIQTLDDDCDTTRIVIILGITGGISLIVLFISIFILWWYRKRFPHKRFFFRIKTKYTKRPEYVTFIIHSSKDKEFVINKLLKPLEDGLKKQLGQEDKLVFLGDRHFEIGSYIQDEIDKAAKLCWTVLPVFSNAFLESEWCKFEIAAAWGRRRIIMPLFIEECDKNLIAGLNKHIFDNYVRYVWPTNRSQPDQELNDREQKLIDGLCKHTANFVQKMEPKVVNRNIEQIERIPFL